MTVTTMATPAAAPSPDGPLSYAVKPNLRLAYVSLEAFYTLRFAVINQTSGEELNIELSDMIAIDSGDLDD